MNIMLSGQAGFGKDTKVDEWIWKQICLNLKYVPSICLSNGYPSFRYKNKRRVLHQVVYEVYCDKNNIPYPEWTKDGVSGFVLDHQDNDKLNNQLENFKLVTPQENTARSNSSLFRGRRAPIGGCVYWHTRETEGRANGRWIAQIKQGDKQYTRSSTNKAFLEDWLIESKEALLNGGEPELLDKSSVGGICEFEGKMQASFTYHGRKYTKCSSDRSVLEAWLIEMAEKVKADPDYYVPVREVLNLSYDDKRKMWVANIMKDKKRFCHYCIDKEPLEKWVSEAREALDCGLTPAPFVLPVRLPTGGVYLNRKGYYDARIVFKGRKYHNNFKLELDARNWLENKKNELFGVGRQR